ncbi:FkbM family methyltransferase [Phenylobacterium sp.]|jgi:FkbM family methyltransferase|uniref:FkbM family methyltransferase n=1 Tax=Phenylobacterium sp. TaxID=1871053 RepID=UPI002E37F4B4|nr:FkbM family methyltransferase [Phenylobacterium sp.]HEX3365625.1 FkbM family methyltransferase [Phenylobacterium sp.]
MPSLRVLGHAFRAWRRNLKWRKHEPETPYLADLLSGAPVCLHVGASDGRHSYVMTQVAPKATIYAFEPAAFSYAVLQLTVAWHGIGKQVTPVHAAVGDRAGEMLLVTPRKISGRMGRAYAFVADEAPDGKARPDLQDTGREIQTTPVVTIDGFCAERGIGKVDFIRMDIEGAELIALRGAERVIDRDRPHMMLEIHPLMLAERFGGTAEQVVAFFKGRGYRMFALNGDRLEERFDAASNLPWKDYFFIHPARAARLPDGVFKARMAA